MPMNPMMRAMHNKVNIPGMPKPGGGSAQVKRPVKAERVQRTEVPRFDKKNPKQKGRIT